MLHTLLENLQKQYGVVMPFTPHDGKWGGIKAQTAVSHSRKKSNHSSSHQPSTHILSPLLLHLLLPYHQL